MGSIAFSAAALDSRTIFFASEQMSNPPATGAASSTIRRSFRAIANWRSRTAERAYSPVFSIALLLIVGVAVKFGH
jgi:hypothetical protein